MQLKEVQRCAINGAVVMVAEGVSKARSGKVVENNIIDLDINQVTKQTTPFRRIEMRCATEAWRVL